MMAISPSDILNLADWLYGFSGTYNPEEVLLRAVIGRYYYAVFHKAKIKLEARGIKIPRAGSEVHQIVIEELKKIDRWLGDAVYQLRRARNKADYDLNQNFNRAYVNSLIYIAIDVWKELDTL